MKKKCELDIRPDAREELREIARVYRKLAGKESAQRIIRKLRESIGHLRTHPLMGVALPDKELSASGYRMLVCGNYLCFYRPIGDTIIVYHIADGRTEYKQLFRSLPED